MLRRRPPNEFGDAIYSAAVNAARPAAAFGDTITAHASADTLGNYTEVMSAGSFAYDCYGLWINFNSGNSSGNADRDHLVTIGIDPAGGTSWTTLIENLAASCAGTYTTLAGGRTYYFPLFIKAGASLAAKMQSRTGGSTIRCWMKLDVLPSRPDALLLGSAVQTFGADTANSCGTTFTPGTTSEGSYAEIGTLDKTLIYFDVGLCINSSAISGGNQHMDVAVGAAGNKKVVIHNAPHMLSAIEEISHPAVGRYGLGFSGDKVYVRGQHGATAIASGQSALVYGVY